MFVVPVEGLRVPDPFSGDDLPVSGRDVAENGYWFRRLREKSVVIGNPPNEEAKVAKKAKDKGAE
jgi:hypothetical protein